MTADEPAGDDEDLVVPVDRLGTIVGSSMHLAPDGVPVPFEARSLPEAMRSAPHSVHVVRGELPPGWRIDSQEVPPGFGGSGGAVELQVVDSTGRWVSVADLLRLGML